MNTIFFLKRTKKATIPLPIFLLYIFLFSLIICTQGYASEEEGSEINSLFSLKKEEPEETHKTSNLTFSTDFAAKALTKISDGIHERTKQIVAYVEDLTALPETLRESWNTPQTQTFIDKTLSSSIEIFISFLCGMGAAALFSFYQRRKESTSALASFFLKGIAFSLFCGVSFILMSFLINEPDLRYFWIQILFGIYVYQLATTALFSFFIQGKTPISPSKQTSDKKNLSISIARSFCSLLKWLLGGYITNLTLDIFNIPSHFIITLWTLLGIVLISLITNIAFKIRPLVEEYLKKIASSIQNPFFSEICTYFSGKIAYLTIGSIVLAYIAFIFEEDTQAFFIKFFSSVLMIFLAYGLSSLWKYLYKIWTDTDSFLARISPVMAMHLSGALKVLGTIFIGIIYFFTFIFITRIWGYNVIGFIDATFNIKSLNLLMDIILTIALGVLLWQGIEISFEHYIKKFALRTSYSSEEKDKKKLQRLETLLPILENSLRWILFVLFTLVILSEIGIDITPFLTGLGLFGLAFSFGAQSLVKDLITGFNVLMDGSINTGDFISIKDIKGNVESISLRNLEVRDIKTGALHIFPFSEVSIISNFSRDFNYCFFEIDLENSADLNQVTCLIESVVQDMRKDPALAPLILDLPAVWGVKKMTGLDVSLEGRFKIAPMAELHVRPEFYKRLRATYVTHGIRLASPSQIIYMETPLTDQSNPVESSSKKLNLSQYTQK